MLVICRFERILVLPIMLHSYSFSNYKSFKEITKVTFELTDKDTVVGWAERSPISGHRLSTAMAVFGPNASGKTSLLQPLAFLAWFLRNSFQAAPDAGIPISAHFRTSGEPSSFEIIADAPEPETLLRYQLKVTPRRVLAESLEQRVRRGQWKSIFDRREGLDGKTHVIQDGFGLDDTQAANVRPNVSLIAWAAQFGVPLAKSLLEFNLITNISIVGRYFSHYDHMVLNCANFYEANPPAKERMRKLLSSWDLGLSDIAFKKNDAAQAPPVAGSMVPPAWLAHGLHTDEHGNNYALPLWQESEGTRSALAILTAILPVLQNGGVIVYDQLDADLHPHMLVAILELFANSDSNPKNAQILFSCHSVEVLKLLQKCQIILVEKDGLESQAWRLDTVEGVRSDENRAAKYLAGAYGAVPRM
jgi:uncharacterized protein